MSDNQPTEAKVQRLKQVSPIWIVPLVALGIGIWMFVQYLNSQGPVITIRLPNASGIEVGKTAIKSLNVKVGVVTKVQLSKDYSYITVTAQMNNDTGRMLKNDTLFWVVKPRIGKGGVSGLDTLLSGSYIEMQPGEGKEDKNHFVALDVPPVAPADAKGLRVILTSRQAGKLGVGDPVLYDGFTVGRVEQVSFDINSKRANYQLFIFEPYDSLVRTSSNFILASGVKVQVGAEGFNVKIGSLESLITGGVTFTTPADDQGSPQLQQKAYYRLYNNRSEVREKMFEQHLDFVMLFSESIRGLKAGAPIEYRGIQIGTVQKVPLRLPTSQEGFTSKQIPVLVRIDLGRVYDRSDEGTLASLQQNLEKEFKQGLRATLKTGNLLTGALYIGTDVYKAEKPMKALTYDGYNLFPTKTGDLAEVQKQLTNLLNKFNKLPVEDTLNSMTATLKASEKTMATMQTTINDLDRLLKQKDTQALPGDVRASLKQIQTTLNGFGPDAAPYQNLEGALTRFEAVMTDLQPVLRQLNEKPNSLVFGDEKTKDPVPVGGR
ncbi:intermembrane transport protein PqiB [Photobacterium kishitanii]|uniref:Intermembrane transport protein PqiB n=1 Tax=Photobacterium kishitanii TaxID=318456 RepID=A0A2T3QZR4_9GAMM|nr:intermembrane transport protein PqiB [Photobacterium kishitanii]KJG10967.1 paraquat-inducible protein B [Photobacterium kishitanii]KJG59974.1 paraquat-inducible protein B [Photobacterium kishitanii]KJG63256.1 paraquat-inducible protein B [Photobacterium kishitanii]KJG67736.1 paraquat-inducible protein B [Photobacterium kishitanii]KJG71428.1 paraquat-inducible protein B [Photobacterium kishitanii]